MFCRKWKVHSVQTITADFQLKRKYQLAYDFLHGTGQDFQLAIAQPTFSKILTETLLVMEQVLCPKWISLRMTENEKRDAKIYFYEKSAIPGVIMCVDGTHVKIIPPCEQKNLYYNRKGF